MKKITGILREIVKRILFLGCCIQIVLGTIWMCLNLPCLQAFSVDWGIFATPLYEGLKRVYPLVFIGQVLFAFAAGDTLFRVLLGRKNRFGSVFGSLVLLTFPFALQCHLAVSPYSLCCSVSLLLCAFLIRLCRREQTAKNLLGAFLCLAALALLSRMTFWAGWCSVAVIMSVQTAAALFRRKAARCGRMLLLFFTLSGCIFGTASLLKTDLVPAPREVGFAVLCRTGWPSLYKGENLLPEELWEAVDEYYPGAQISRSEFEKTVYPGILEQYGVERGTELFWEISSVCVQLEWPYLIKQCVGDGMGNLFLPIWYQRQLSGEWYASCLGRNYEMFLLNTPAVSSLVVQYCLRGYPFFLFFTVILLLVRGKAQGKSGLAGVLLFALLSAVMATLRGAGMLDGKETLVANLFLYMIAVNQMFSSGTVFSGDSGISEEREV